MFDTGRDRDWGRYRNAVPSGDVLTNPERYGVAGRAHALYSGVSYRHCVSFALWRSGDAAGAPLTEIRER